MISDITTLPETELSKSHTYLLAKNNQGRCTRCQQMTLLLESCCAMPIEFRGRVFSLADLWGEIEKELLALAEPDYDAQRKDDAIDFGGDEK